MSTLEILLAEDNVADVGLVRMALTQHGLNYALHVARDGDEAIQFLRRLDRDPKLPRLDLLLVDLHLPGRDGEAILKSLRSTEHYAQTPAIVMTASDSPDDHARAQKQAALHYFRKPSVLAEFMLLGEIVQSVIGNSRPSADHEPC